METEEPERFPPGDAPWTHYFNGEALPRWSNSWHLLPLLDRAEKLMRDWDSPVGFGDLWRLHCRMDHCGRVESEQPDVFRLCCLALVFVLLRDEAAIPDSLAKQGSDYGGSPSEIFSGVRDGLFVMHQRSARDGIAFWTSGHESDREFLVESIRRHRHLLPQSDPEWLEAPHVTRNRWETDLRIRFLRKDVMSLLGTRALPKDVRRFIHELPG